MKFNLTRHFAKKMEQGAVSYVKIEWHVIRIPKCLFEIGNGKQNKKKKSDEQTKHEVILFIS